MKYNVILTASSHLKVLFSSVFIVGTNFLLVVDMHLAVRYKLTLV